MTGRGAPKGVQPQTPLEVTLEPEVVRLLRILVYNDLMKTRAKAESAQKKFGVVPRSVEERLQVLLAANQDLQWSPLDKR